MSRRMWCLRGRKDKITVIDKNGRTRTQHKPGAHYLDCSILHCERYCLNKDDGTGCYDPERHWCIPNDAPIYSVKRLWWKNNVRKIERSIEMVNKDIVWLENFLEEMFGIRVTQMHQLSLKEKNRFLREIRNRIQWNNYRKDLEIDCFLDSIGEEYD